MDQTRVPWAYATNKWIIALALDCEFWKHQLKQLIQSCIIHSLLFYWSQISETANYSHLCFNHFYLHWQIKTIGAHLSKVLVFLLTFPYDSNFMLKCVYNPEVLWQVMQTRNKSVSIQMVICILMIPLVNFKEKDNVWYTFLTSTSYLDN